MSKLSILKIAIAVLASGWTLTIVISLLEDLLRPGTNYFGGFFGTFAALTLAAIGNGILFVVYLLIKRLMR